LYDENKLKITKSSERLCISSKTNEQNIEFIENNENKLKITKSSDSLSVSSKTNEQNINEVNKNVQSTLIDLSTVIKLYDSLKQYVDNVYKITKIKYSKKKQCY